MRKLVASRTASGSFTSGLSSEDEASPSEDSARAAPRRPGHVSSTPRRPHRVDVQRIDRRAAGHEQPVALRAAEAEVANHLRRMEEGQQLAAGCMDAHAVGVDSAPAPSAPDIALGVTADTVRESWLEVDENFPAAQRGAVAHAVE